MKVQNETLSKQKLTIILSFVVIALTGVFVIANSIVGKHSQLADITNVLGVSTANNFYDVKVVGIQQQQAVAGEATKRVSLQVGVTNKTAQTLQIAPGLQMFLTSNTGKIYPITARYMTPGVLIGGPLAANGYTSLSIDYEISASEQPASFSFQEDLSKPTVTIKL